MKELLQRLPALQASLALHAALAFALYVVAPVYAVSYGFEPHLYAVSLANFAELAGEDHEESPSVEEGEGSGEEGAGNDEINDPNQDDEWEAKNGLHNDVQAGDHSQEREEGSDDPVFGRRGWNDAIGVGAGSWSPRTTPLRSVKQTPTHQHRIVIRRDAETCAHCDRPATYWRVCTVPGCGKKWMSTHTCRGR